MSVRLTIKLEKNGIETIAELVDLADSDLVEYLGLSGHSLECVRNVRRLVMARQRTANL